MQPFPQDAEADFAGCHVFHEVQDVLIAEIVGRLERGSLKSLFERVAVLQGNAQQVTRAADGSRRRLEQKQVVRIGSSVGEWREFSAELIGLSDLLPDRPYDLDHLPMRDPLAAGALALLAFGAGDGPFHSVADAGFRADWNVGLHSTLPQRVLAKTVWSIARAPHAIFVIPHVAVGHRDDIDIRIDELRIPGHRIGDAVDVIPASGVEADEMFSKSGSNFH